MLCKICQRPFIPNKYHPRQEICLSPQCRHLRQLRNMRIWRMKNPNYFKSRGQKLAWRENRRTYARQWRKRHRDYLKKYSLIYRLKRRKYMREYMRQYRRRFEP